MIHIVVPGPPPRKNARGTIARSRKTGKPIRITPKKTKAWRSRLYEVFDEYQRSGISRGMWKLRVDVYEDELRHLDVDVPNGDFDASLTAIADAMQPKWKRRRGCRPVLVAWGMLDDDARIIEGTVRKHYDKANPRVEITLTEIVDG